MAKTLGLQARDVRRVEEHHGSQLVLVDDPVVLVIVVHVVLSVAACLRMRWVLYLAEECGRHCSEC